MRIEKKYLIPMKDFIFLKEILPSFYSWDIHSGPDGYLVTSLYYDTSRFKAYYDKEDGLNIKAKWRFRMYNKDLKTLRLEEKKKYGQRSEKIIHPHSILESMELAPKLLVEYSRLAFQSQNFRLTLDYDLRFAQGHDFNSMKEDIHYVRDEHIVFEIKSLTDSLDPFLTNFLEKLHLTSSSFSKYSYGVRKIYDL